MRLQVSSLLTGEIHDIGLYPQYSEMFQKSCRLVVSAFVTITFVIFVFIYEQSKSEVVDELVMIENEDSLR